MSSKPIMPKLLVAGMAVVLLTLGYGVWSIISVEADCGDLAGGSGADDRLIVGLEVGGNTSEWADEAASVLDTAVSQRLGAFPEDPFALEVVLSFDGLTVRPSSACLDGSVLIQPNSKDIDVLKDEKSPDAARAQSKDRIASDFADQTSLVSSELKSSIRSLESASEPSPGKPAAEGSNVALTVLPLWEEVASRAESPGSGEGGQEQEGPQVSLTIWSPLISTADDCLRYEEGQDRIAAVEDCVTVGSITKLPKADVSLVYPAFFVSSAGQKSIAKLTIQELCERATSAGCLKSE